MKAIGTPARDVQITGCCFAVHASKKLPGLQRAQEVIPVLLTIEGIEYFPIFTHPDKLCAALAGKVWPFEMKRIDSGYTFLHSVSYPVILDPWVTPEGNTRFMLVSAR